MPHLIHIGNSLGVRIPKAIIAQVGLDVATDFEFKVTNEGLLIAPVRQPREEWEKAFKASSKSKKKELFLSEEIENRFDKDEWEW